MNHNAKTIISELKHGRECSVILLGGRHLRVIRNSDGEFVCRDDWHDSGEIRVRHEDVIGYNIQTGVKV